MVSGSPLIAPLTLGKNLKHCHSTITTSFYSSLFPPVQLLNYTESHSSCHYFQVSGVLLVVFI